MERRRSDVPSVKSLSWYKKRTAALNKALGTSYSPSVIRGMDIKSISRGRGYSDIGARLQAISDPRSARGQQDVQAAAKFTVMSQWEAAAANNYNIWLITTHVGQYMSADGNSVYEKMPTGDYSVINKYSDVVGTVKEIPSNAFLLTPQTATRLAEEKAKEYKHLRNWDAKKGAPGTGGYRDI